MRNYISLLLLGSLACSLALASLTGCAMWNKHSDGRTAAQIDTDRTVTTNVRDALKREPVYKFSNVDVNTYDRVVQLSGFVNTDDQKRRAGEVAQQTPGADKVINNITVVPETGPTPTGRPTGANQPRNTPNNPPPPPAQPQPPAPVAQ